MTEEYGTAPDLVYDAIIRDLAHRAWPADARLKPSELAARYGAAASSVREAMIRIAAEGFIRNFPQRGFRTIKGTPRSVSELAGLRVAIDTEATRLSIANGGLEWEANLAAAHHRLSHLETRLRRRDAPSDDELRMWTEADHYFHFALISACGSEVLIMAQRDAFNRFRIHLASVDADCGFRGAALIREHEAILEAALDRDAMACDAAIRAHFEHYPSAMVAQDQSESVDAG